MTSLYQGLTIAEVAERTGLTAHTLRYYERAGLFPPPERGWNGHRRYSEQDLGLLDIITRLRATGMSIAETRQYAQMCRDGATTVPARRQLLQEHRERVVERIASLQRDLGLIDKKIESYYAMDTVCGPPGSRRERHNP
jgi:DNA-binding transcriptional MerR regulator